MTAKQRIITAKALGQGMNLMEGVAVFTPLQLEAFCEAYSREQRHICADSMEFTQSLLEKKQAVRNAKMPEL